MVAICSPIFEIDPHSLCRQEKYIIYAPVTSLFILILILINTELPLLNHNHYLSFVRFLCHFLHLYSRHHSLSIFDQKLQSLPLQK